MEDFTFKDKDDVWYPDFANYLFVKYLRGCGCGSADEIAEDVLKVFIALGERGDDNWNECGELIYSDKYHELIAHMIDGAGLIEHGSSIGGSWLNEEGKEVYKEYKESLK